MKLGHTWDWNPGLLGKRPVCDRPSHPRIPLFFLFILLCNCSIILRSVGQLTRLLYIQCIQPPPTLSFSLTRGTIVVIWWSSQLQLALPVGSNLHSCVCCPHSEPSERRSVLVPWPGCYQRIFFYPPEGQDCHTAPSLFSLFFLHLCRSLRVMQMHSPDPSTHPISILRVLSPVWAGCARGWQNQGRWNEWKHCTSSHQFPSVFNVLLIHNPLKLLNLAA